jgi:DNA-binding response OmpR family regulator
VGVTDFGPVANRRLLTCLPSEAEHCEIVEALADEYDVVSSTNATVAAAVAEAVPVDVAVVQHSAAGAFQTVRRRHHLSVLVVLDSDAVAEALSEAGLASADDFIVKPFSMAELRRRVAMLARAPRSARIPPGELPGPDGVLVRPTARELVVAGEAIRLRPLECAVLRVLLDHRGEVVGVDTLLNEVWGPERASRNLVEAQISRIRAKLRGTEADGLITTVHGVGYLVR